MEYYTSDLGKLFLSKPSKKEISFQEIYDCIRNMQVQDFTEDDVISIFQKYYLDESSDMRELFVLICGIVSKGFIIGDIYCDDGTSLLELAVMCNSKEIVELFISESVSRGEKLFGGKKALRIAKKNKLHDIREVLENALHP